MSNTAKISVVALLCNCMGVCSTTIPWWLRGVALFCCFVNVITLLREDRKGLL